MATARSTRQVLESHLACRQAGDLDSDIAENYADDVVILTMEGVFHGAEGLRRNARELRRYFGESAFTFPVIRVVDRFAFLEWRTRNNGAEAVDGSDSFVIEDGRIVCQTIRYTVRPDDADTTHDGRDGRKLSPLEAS